MPYYDGWVGAYCGKRRSSLTMMLMICTKQARQQSKREQIDDQKSVGTAERVREKEEERGKTMTLPRR